MIIDGDQFARDRMSRVLAFDHDLEVVQQCETGMSALASMRTQMPDLVLLDVHLPDCDAFRLVARIGVDNVPPMIFVTADRSYALQAFEVNAVDYGLKPFDNGRLVESIERARSRVRARHDRARAQEYESFLAWAAKQVSMSNERVPGEGRSAVSGPTMPAYLSRLTVRENGRVQFVACAEIESLEADGNYVRLFAKGRSYRIRARISRLAEELDPQQFVRIHRCTIVNVDRVNEMQRSFGGDYVAILQSGKRLRVSRSRAGRLLESTG